LDVCIPDGMKLSVLVYLACQIVNNGGGGGGGAQQVYHSNGDPNGVVLVTTALPCLCIDTLNAVIWQKSDGAVSNTGWASP